MILLLSYCRPSGPFSCLGFNRFGREWLKRKDGSELKIVRPGFLVRGSHVRFQVGTSGTMLANRQRRTLAFAALFCAGVAVSVTLGGCSSQIADLPVIGTPADAPARPKEPGAYLPVNA